MALATPDWRLRRTVIFTMGNRTTYQYDVMGNITSMTNAKQKTTKYEYDAEGNMTSLTSPMGRKEQYTYDVGGRMTECLTPSGGRIFYDYDTLNALADKSYSSANELGNDRPVRMVYNSMGQRISMEDITGESTYTYDSLGRLKTATNGSGKTVEYYYDEADNLQEILYPDGYAVLYEYDKNDNITKLTDRDGRETVYDYDPLNRLTKVVRPDGSQSEYTYNARNQVLEAKNTCVCGFLISDYQYTYNDAGLVTKEVAKEDLFTSNKDHGHNGGEKDKCAHADGSGGGGNDPWWNGWDSQNPWQNQNPEWETTVRTFTYDDNGEMTGCEESKGQFHKVTYTYRYVEAGNRTFAKKAKTFPYSYLESWQNTYTYNDDNQMVAATVCEGNLTKKYTFTYDANGNLTHECFGQQAEVVYQYDTENRLTAVYDQQKLLMASTYDGDGNRAFQLNYNPDAVCGYGLGWGGEVYMPEHSQNEDGSLTAEGQLFSYLCSETGRYYDLTEYVNDTNRQYTQVLTAYTVNSGATESYSYAGDTRNSRNNIWSEGRGEDYNETSYYLYDGRGSVTANTWYNGRVTDVYQYDPYGQVTLGSTEHTDFYGYNAESYNPNTGLEYLRARYYNAKQGRFFQEDTYLGEIADPLTLNRYAYVKNSPLNYIDPSGHRSVESLLPNTPMNNPGPWNRPYISQLDKYMDDIDQTPVADNRTSLPSEVDRATEICYRNPCQNVKMVEEGMWQYDVLVAIEKMRTGRGYYSTGFVMGGAFMIWSYNVSIGLVIDGEGNIAVVKGNAMNVGSPEVGLSAGVYEQVMPDVPDYKYAGGKSVQVGGTVSAESLGIPVSVGNETNIIEDGDEIFYGNTTTVSISASLSPGEVHAGYTDSEVEYLFNYLDELEDIVWSTVR